MESLTKGKKSAGLTPVLAVVRNTVNRLFVILISLQPAAAVVAATHADLYDFSPLVYSDVDDVSTNWDGASPMAGVVVSSNVLYGTAWLGGAAGNGTVFRINTDGSCFTNLHSFSRMINTTNSDGASPLGGLLLIGNNLYGTASVGGAYGWGVVYRLKTDGSGFTNLHDFNVVDGYSPSGELIATNDILFGVTSSYLGPLADNDGTIFSIKTDGSEFTNIYKHPSIGGASFGGTLLLVGTNFYGTRLSPGGNPQIFRVNFDGTGFTTLFDVSVKTLQIYGLAILSNTLFGAMNSGPVFSLSIDGADFTNLISFDGNGLNGGLCPDGGVLAVDGVLFGTTSQGSYSDVYNSGTIYRINADGSCYTNLYDFRGTNGGWPVGEMVISGHTLYGLTEEAGKYGSGTVFSLNLNDSIPLSITQASNQQVLSWDNPDFHLQFTTNLSVPFLTLPEATSPYTNSTIGPQFYFRLKSD